MARKLRADPNSLIILCVYLVAYVILDRISLVQTLPNVGFTLWNPPPACSLALLIINGLWFAPALFVAAVLADVLNGAVSIWVWPALILEVIVAAGYTVVAVALRPFVRPVSCLQSVRDVTWFLGISSLGVLAIAGSVGLVLMLMDLLPVNGFAATVRQFWIGDLAGILGLFPVLMTRSSCVGAMAGIADKQASSRCGSFCARRCNGILDRLRRGASS